jgi:hypothetical protein
MLSRFLELRSLRKRRDDEFRPVKAQCPEKAAHQSTPKTEEGRSSIRRRATHLMSHLNRCVSVKDAIPSFLKFLNNCIDCIAPSRMCSMACAYAVRASSPCCTRQDMATVLTQSEQHRAVQDMSYDAIFACHSLNSKIPTTAPDILQSDTGAPSLSVRVAIAPILLVLSYRLGIWGIGAVAFTDLSSQAIIT